VAVRVGRIDLDGRTTTLLALGEMTKFVQTETQIVVDEKPNIVALRLHRQGFPVKPNRRLEVLLLLSGAVHRQHTGRLLFEVSFERHHLSQVVQGLVVTTSFAVDVSELPQGRFAIHGIILKLGQ